MPFWRQMPGLAPSRQAHFLSARVVSGSADGSINPSHSLRGGASLATAPCGMGALRAAPFLYDKKGISRKAQKSAKATPRFRKLIPG